MKANFFKLFAAACCFLLSTSAFAQLGNGVLSGDLQLNQNFYLLDSSIFPNGNTIPPQYYQQLSSTEAWLNLNYRVDNFSFGMRFDLFQNSGLRNPQAAYTNQGIGYWYAQHKVDKLDITVGYFYDQFGTGVAFRAYEQRGQNLDYAMQGIRLKYYIDSSWTIKAFAGRQKNQFDFYPATIKGVQSEKQFAFNDNFNLTINTSVVNRTMDNATAQTILNNVNQQPISDRFDVKRNAFVYTGGINLTYKNFSLLSEYNYKTAEAMNDNKVDTLGPNSYSVRPVLVNRPGSVWLTSLSYSKSGFGVIAQYKRTDHFDWRTSPNEILNYGMVAFIPPVARMNTYRLVSRYSPATQLMGEQGFQLDLTKKLGKHEIQMNISQSTDLRNQLLYRELYLEGKSKIGKKIRAVYGIQFLNYNFGTYQKQEVAGTLDNTGSRLVKAITPYLDITYRMNRKQSLRMELSHMSTKQDYGSWWWGLLEYNVAPKYSFSIMDMWNYGNPVKEMRIHYYTIFAAMNLGKNRITAGYVKQVQGVICNGGVCRIEPAFNGFRLTLTSNF